VPPPPSYLRHRSARALTYCRPLFRMPATPPAVSKLSSLAPYALVMASDRGPTPSHMLVTVAAPGNASGSSTCT
jgi:hypothetical protein